MFHHFFRRFFPPVPPVKRITIRAFAGVAMLFHLPFFSFFIISSRYARGEMAPPPNFPPPPRVSISRIHERANRGWKFAKGRLHALPFRWSPGLFSTEFTALFVFKGLTRASFFFLSSKRENDKIIFERNCADIGTIGIFIRKCRGISSNFRI